MKTAHSTEGRRQEMIRNILTVATGLAAEGGGQLSMGAIAKAGKISVVALREAFPTVEALVDALYLDLCRQKNVVIQTQHDPIQSLIERAFAIWHGHVTWAQNNPAANMALNHLNLANSPSDKARTIEALNFPDAEIAEQFAANEIFDDCDPMYADALVIAIVDTTVQLIRLCPDQEQHHLRTGFLLVQRLLLQ